MIQVRTHTWSSGTSPKLKSLQDLSIEFNTKVTEEVVHRLLVSKDIHPLLESSDHFHCTPSLVNPITDVLLQRSVPAGYLAEVEVLGWRLSLG
jgi:hypothetical protein